MRMRVALRESCVEPIAVVEGMRDHGRVSPSTGAL